MKPSISILRRKAQAAFTLIELMVVLVIIGVLAALIVLLVVVAIIAIATAGVSFALRDSGESQLEREGQRLAALFESARAQSRSTGVPVRWSVVAGGFRFDGVAPDSLPGNWLADG